MTKQQAQLEANKLAKALGIGWTGSINKDVLSHGWIYFATKGRIGVIQHVRGGGYVSDVLGLPKAGGSIFSDQNEKTRESFSDPRDAVRNLVEIFNSKMTSLFAAQYACQEIVDAFE